MSKFFKLLAKILLALIILAIVGNLVVFAISAPKIKGSAEDLQSDFAQAGLQHAECALVLGASVNPDGSPGEYVEERLKTAIGLYMNGYVDKLLLSGDNGQVEYNEVEVMKNYALKVGIPEDDIFLDHAGFSTYDSMHRAQSVFCVKSVIVVTQKFHIYRALATGRILGIDVQGCAAANVEMSTRYWIYMQAREFLARDKDLIKSVLRVKPTYLGEQIPISGDGHASWD